MDPATRTSQLPADSGWLQDAVADEASDRWHAGLIALASAVDAATAAFADPVHAPLLGARLAALHDAVQSHLFDLDDLAAGGARGPEYGAYAAQLRRFRDGVQAWRHSRGEGRPRSDGPPPVLPGPGEVPMPSFANAAWKLVGDAMILAEWHQPAPPPQPLQRRLPAQPAQPAWRRWWRWLTGRG